MLQFFSLPLQLVIQPTPFGHYIVKKGKRGSQNQNFEKGAITGRRKQILWSSFSKRERLSVLTESKLKVKLTAFNEHFTVTTRV